MQKIWNVKKYDDEYIDKICKIYGISDMLAKLLVARNIEFDDIEIFLNGTLDDLSDPYILKDMDKYVERVSRAALSGEKIVIYGDYDVDGVTSITIMYKFLKELGANVDYYLPDRLAEGYGLNIDAIAEMKKSNVSLIITVDCGITAVEEVDFARSQGIDVCITDHHECAEVLPNAYSIVNPKQQDDKSKFKMFAGVGVAFKCITALAIKYNLSKESYLKYLDIVAIGTISDIVALVDENRIIAKYGLKEMASTKNVGVKALLKLVNAKEIDSMMISFGIAPRINACGRMGNASVAVKLLLEEDEFEAAKIASQLEEQNVQRQNVEKDIYEKAIAMIEKDRLDKKNSIVLWDKGWHSGVIGIVASRLVNMYSKPVVLFTYENDVARGSGRCQVGFSLYETLFNCKDTLIQYGGHELAAGLTVEVDKLNDFRDAFENAVNMVSDGEISQVIDIDDTITKQNLSASLIKDIKILKPYGQGNKVPLFIYKGLKVQSIRTIKDDKHLKFTLWDSGSLIEAIAFSKGERRDELRLGDKIDVICNVELNSYNLPKTIQLIVQDFKKCVD